MNFSNRRLNIRNVLLNGKTNSKVVDGKDKLVND